MVTKLKEIIISITNRCNLRCKMCQIPQAENNGEMDTVELKELIKDAVSLNPSSIVFSGGEPLLREDIFELIEFADRCKLNTCLTSNGTLIDNDVAKKLSSSGMGIVNISIEGPEEIHDTLRGKGSFKKAVEALKLLSSYKIESTIATVILKQNYKFMDFVLELAHKLGVTTIKFQPFSEIFLTDKTKGRDFFISFDELKDIKKMIEKTISLAQLYKIATNPADYLRGIPLYLTGLLRNHLNYSCAAISETCPVSPEGNIYLCWVLSDKILGNARQVRLSQLWNSEMHRQLQSAVKKEGCPGCLMSCYDYNFGNYSFWEAIFLKAKKFKKPKFYKRLYYRIYQYLSYLLRKLTNHIFLLKLKISKSSNISLKKNSCNINVLKEVKIAKELLEAKLEAFKKK